MWDELPKKSRYNLKGCGKEFSCRSGKTAKSLGGEGVRLESISGSLYQSWARTSKAMNHTDLRSLSLSPVLT